LNSNYIVEKLNFLEMSYLTINQFTSEEISRRWNYHAMS